MPSAYLLPNGRTQFFNPLTGTFLALGTVYTYVAGTSTPQNTWADGNQVTLNANPITLDAYGSASIFWNGDYKVSVFDALGNLVYTQDNMTTTALVAGQIQGTSTNDNATAGNVGEYITATGTGVALTSGTTANITSVSLTAGDWQVTGAISFAPSIAAADVFYAGLNSSSATLPGSPFSIEAPITVINTVTFAATVPSQRFSLSATTSVYLCAAATFASGTCAATAIIEARRAR
jgi:hypothetical protein